MFSNRVVFGRLESWNDGMLYEMDLWERLAALKVPGLAGHAGRNAKDTRLFADARVREVLAAKEIATVIPGRKKRKLPIEYAKEMYKKRHKIENGFSRIQDFGGIASRYDKRAYNFLSRVYVAATMTWIH